jgi:hypothetical protein
MTTTSNGGADLRALMAIADRYARRLVADTNAPVAVLLVERAGELDVVMLDGEGAEAIPQARLLLARTEATSAALLIDLAPAPPELTSAAFWIFGESIDGATARRRYRFRPRFRARRLTHMADDEDPEVEGLFRPLFPAHTGTGGADDGTVDAAGATTPKASANAVATPGPHPVPAPRSPSPTCASSTSARRLQET